MLNYSFIIPHKNSPKLLNRCINSIPRRHDVEIIIVDDNSDSQIVDWKHFKFDDLRCVTLIQDTSNKGAGNARNIGIDHAHGKWLLFPDADDFYQPGFLDVLDNYKDADIDILYFSYQFITEDNKVLTHPIISHINNYCSKSIGLDYIQYKNYTPWDKMVKADFVATYNCRYECVPSGNDMFFSLQIAYFAKQIKIINKPLYNYVKYSKSQTNRNWSQKKIYLSLENLIKRNRFYSFVGLKKWNHNIFLTLAKNLFDQKNRKNTLSKLIVLLKCYKYFKHKKDDYVLTILTHKIFAKEKIIKSSISNKTDHGNFYSKDRLLLFHPGIAPYRIDLFNDLYESFQTRVCLSFKFDTFKDYNYIESKLHFKPIYLRSRRKNPYSTRFGEYIRQLKEYQPDIVVTSEFGTNTIITILYRFLCHKHYKVVSLCDDSYNMVADNNDFSLYHRIIRRIIVPFLDNLILVEPKVVAWYQLHFHKGIWFPIIRDDNEARATYKRLLPESQKLLTQYHLSGKHVFLFVGRLVALKNVGTIIKAFSCLDTEHNVLVIIGSGEESQKLRDLADNHNNVIFTGRLENNTLYCWYNIANALILASYQESFGAVTNEALLAGCWAIVSRRAGSQCLVMPGVNGDVFSPTDTDELCQKMKEICKLLPALPDYLSLKPNAMIYGYRELLGNLVETLMLSENSLSDKCT